MADQRVRLLVKIRPSAAGTTIKFAASGSPTLKLTPLFSSIEQPGKSPGRSMGAVAPPTWHMAAGEATGVNPWDLCHELMKRGLGVAGGTGVAFAEPDIEQQWPWSQPGRELLSLTGTCGPPAPEDGDVYPIKMPHTWFREPAYSQLEAAQQAIGSPTAAKRIRIAHVDTGYDPQHVTKPAHLRTDLQRNFVDGENPSDASDQSHESFATNHGHGTATLALLAGGAFDASQQFLGAAANLDIVPIRVANSVILFRNSAIAQAFDYIHSLWNDPAKRVHVVTMSMGGLASAAWADAVNALYERGIFVVTAAGNNFGNLPTRFTVYPARFNRVVAACGVMADGRPWADLPIRKMAGCYGPREKEATAMAAYTPNVPWAKIGCADLLDWDGNGTSSATPQIAAAAALWMQKNSQVLDAYPKAWMRVEATRQALFASAGTVSDAERMRRFGRGMLRANDALGRQPAAASALHAQQPDSASFALIRVITGLGLQPENAVADRMLELEALQISQRSSEVAQLLEELDEGRDVPRDRILDAIASQSTASQALKAQIGRQRHDVTVSTPPAGGPAVGTIGGARTAAPATATPPSKPPRGSTQPIVPQPATRLLRVFAFDPSASTQLDTFHLNEARLRVKWEADLRPGPVGEYLEVVDVDPPSNAAYLPVDLNEPALLVADGFTPSIGRPQFHQQMVYAVAMKTIDHFERALGRVALWAERFEKDRTPASRFVRRLRIYPHALREANAFYSPEKRALLFGYFNAQADDVGDNLPGGTVFTCLSHDIVAHETSHALLDGLHPRYKEATGLDMLAFHEAFSDIVALFQHFTLPDALRDQIGRSQGQLGLASGLSELAKEFGQAIGHRKALRNAVGNKAATRADYESAVKPHDRGAVLVGAVFEAFIKIYTNHTERLFRLATGGTGVLPPGNIPHDLVEALAEEAAKIAERVLNICIRALDYCPPVDLRFGEYLRALITADRELVPDDGHLYRVAFVQAFRARGIYPPDVSNLSIDALVWEKPDFDYSGLKNVVAAFASKWSLTGSRYEAYVVSNSQARDIYFWAMNPVHAELINSLGLVQTKTSIETTIDGIVGKLSPIEIHSVRPLRRVGPASQILNHAVIEITQSFRPKGSEQRFRGGCTIIFDRDNGDVRYVIRKRVGSISRIDAQQAFQAKAIKEGLHANYFMRRAFGAEPFAMMHRHD